MVNKIDWNLIELTEVYEAYDNMLKFFDEDFERIRRLVDAAVKHGADPESMTEPIDEFAVELHLFCNAINSLKDQKENKTQNP